MKKIFIVSIIIGIAISAAKAQEVGFGIKAGLNYSKISGDWENFSGPADSIGNFRDSVGSLINLFTVLYPAFANLVDNRDSTFTHSSENRIGGHGGIFFNIPISENFSVHPEIIFSMKGASVEFNNTFNFSGDSTYYYIDPNGDTVPVARFDGKGDLKYDLKYDITLFYIDVPILSKYKFNNGITIGAGPYVSFLASSREKYETTLTGNLLLTQTDLNDNTTQTVIDSTQTIFVEEIIKSNDNLKTFQAGFSANIGYEFPFGLGINAGYSGAFTELFDKKEDEGFKNSVFHFSLSYKIFNNLFKLE